ncbi:hypothetical protein D9M68_962450 [compost metagenome]
MVGGDRPADLFIDDLEFVRGGNDVTMEALHDLVCHRIAGRTKDGEQFCGLLACGGPQILGALDQVMHCRVGFNLLGKLSKAGFDLAA